MWHIIPCMPKKSKTRYVDINAQGSGFVSKFIHSHNEIDLSDIKILRGILSNEKAKILYTLKTKKPKSIYQLSKILERDLKSVRGDLAVLERFGFIEFVAEKKGKRESLMPVLIVDSLQIIINI